MSSELQASIATLSKVVGDIENHFVVREKERAHEVKSTLEYVFLFFCCDRTCLSSIRPLFANQTWDLAQFLRAVYHHQHQANAQRLLRYREYARRILAARIRDRQQAVANTLLAMIEARYLPRYAKDHVCPHS